MADKVTPEYCFDKARECLEIVGTVQQSEAWRLLGESVARWEEIKKL